LNMAIVGGAVLPVIQGAIGDHFGLHHSFGLPVICYLYILFYAVSGSRPNRERYGRERDQFPGSGAQREIRASEG